MLINLLTHGWGRRAAALGPWLLLASLALAAASPAPALAARAAPCAAAACPGRPATGPEAPALVLINTGAPDGRMAMASRPEHDALVEIEAADDFIVTTTVRIDHATFTGLLPSAASLNNIQSVEVEIYRVFPKDSANPPSGHVPTRVNSPSDVDFDARDSGSGLSFSPSVLNPSLLVANSVLNGIHPSPNQTTGGDGAVSGEEVQFSVTLTEPFVLAPDHYFFIPKVQLSSGDFYWLSAAGPAVFAGDLQAWIRNSNLDPDWLRVGTDIVGGNPAPTFNASFTLSAVPEVPSGALMLVGLAAVATVLRRRAEKRASLRR
jgi:hypothetical protein